MIAVEIVVASSIVIYLAITESRIALVVLWVVGLFLVGAYSLEPLRFKRRGFLNLVTLALILYFLPSLYIYYAMAPQLKMLPLLALLGFSTQMIGLLLVNQIEDYHEDKQIQIPQFHRTPELGFHVLLIEGAAQQLELGKPSRWSSEHCEK
jgi:4-hydroxybenzoate polyprenyltransferase